MSQTILLIQLCWSLIFMQNTNNKQNGKNVCPDSSAFSAHFDLPDLAEPWSPLHCVEIITKLIGLLVEKFFIFGYSYSPKVKG